MDTPGKRLKSAREKAGFASARQAAMALDIPVSTYNAHERAGPNDGRMFSPADARKYARRFGVSAAWLLLADGESSSQREKNNQLQPIASKIAPVRGIVKAGTWAEYEEMDYEELNPVPFVPGKYASMEQFAFKVAGTSANKLRILNGDFVICVNYWEVRSTIIDGDIVVVERRDPRVERTIKRVAIVADGFELRPESDDPRHKPIFISKNNNFSPGEDQEVEIIGLVIGRYAPFL